MSMTAEDPDLSYLSPIEEVIEEARNGRMFVLVDAEDRENEGDFIIPAQMATPEAINFMAKYGRGLICLSMTGERVDQLNLKLMSARNQSRHQTAFTVSIEAREGVSTGISAHDRARTIAVAIDQTKGEGDIVTPGHVFPLIAKDGGVLVRAGHTEAAVDIARLAGLYPAGVICEVMNDDGTMARLPDLIKIAREHKLKVGTIEDLIRYRRRYDHFLQKVMEQDLRTDYSGAWRLHIYKNTLDGAEHLALVKGDITTPEPVLVRMHALNVLEDVLGLSGGRGGQLTQAMRAIDQEGRGVVVLIRGARTNSISEMLAAREAGEPGPEPAAQASLREYGVGAQILQDLGLTDMIILSNHAKHVVGLEGYDLRIVGQRAIPALTGIAGGAPKP